MIYSVWNQGSRQYDYYSAAGSDERANAPAPGHLRARPLGIPPADAAWPLPSGAKPMGAGPLPKGRIAAPRNLLGVIGLGDTRPGGVAMAIGLGVAAVLLWRYAR